MENLNSYIGIAENLLKKQEYESALEYLLIRV